MWRNLGGDSRWTDWEVLIWISYCRAMMGRGGRGWWKEEWGGHGWRWRWGWFPRCQIMAMLKADYMLTQVRGCVGGQLGWCLGPRWQAPASQIWNNPLQNFQSFPGPVDSAVHPLPLLLSPPPPGYWCMVLWTTIFYQVLCCRASVFRHVDWIITISLFSSFNSHPSHGYAKSLKVAKTNWKINLHIES